MNKAITDGLVLMPPPFSAGLNLWSREDGQPGQGSYAGQSNAAIVPADQDFGGALELQKTQATQKLRCFQQIPMQPGLYLRVTVRIKGISGALPSVRIAGWAGRSNGTNVPGVVQTGPSVALTQYGQVVEVTAIIGAGGRGGVTMAWGASATYGHIGLDLTGPNGGVVRIDDIEIEDVTGIYLRDIFDAVDVRDFGARGDGVADDTAAFAAADAAAQGRTVTVPAGTYLIAGNLTINNPIRFQGTLTQPANVRLALTRNYDLDTYTSAFGNELLGFRKALQALFYFTDHVALDLSDRRIDLVEPLDVAAIAGLTTFAQRRFLTNGQLNAVAGPGWDTVEVTSGATYTPANPNALTAVANIAAIPVGARVSGTGVGREVYVTDRNIGTNTLTLSQPLWGGAGTRVLTFTRYKYLLDFSGFEDLSRFELDRLDLNCNGLCSAVMLPRIGLTLTIKDCVFNRPKDRGITSTGTGCQGLIVDGCQFWSNEQPMLAQDRTTIALNVNANDAKIRSNRVVRFAHFMVANGGGHLISGNHFFQGDNAPSGIRRAGLIITQTNPRVTFTGNYVDNCFIEWSNEHDADPDFTTGLGFGNLSIAGNHFYASGVAPWFRWIVIAPKGTGHFVQGLTISDNTFRAVNGAVDRVDAVDTTHATLDFSRFRNVSFGSNAFNGVSQIAMNPLTILHTQNTEAATWVVDGGAFMPFGARVRNTQSLVADGAITNAAGVAQYVMPYVQNEQGADRNLAHLRWPVAVKGKVLATLRCDNPT
ncbi:right-handed parallel beta-helix repeat-containing protein [Pseudotabrizicola sediminis]|uniref:Right-handed parallel beta-helix repeat-containing protein n=1 Tax=Pseudotabrizicola sediminis TaxID=2486418 RepID=A0ABY2KLR0_9RHOB|nr:glycosyl hydrolase family 28-related protein [Pseudotabrizicola sediminis]TGD43482.1 right-handed parallel beta-helix repeat-containing protein [Pseudotabrizicola sediminis]